MMRQEIVNGYEVMSDGRMVWINSQKGYAVGRFGYGGIDVHKDYEAQRETGTECLSCRPGPATQEYWVEFKALMLEHYGVVVTDRHRPKFLGGPVDTRKASG